MRTLALVLLAAALASCASSTIAPTGDPITDLSNPDLKPKERIAAIDRAWQAARSGVADRAETRSTLKAVVWSRSPDPVRAAALRALLNDTDPDGIEDTRRLIRLRLPTEPSRDLVGLMADAAVANAWTDVVPSLVQSWARPDATVPDDRRIERRAIAALVPDVPVAQTVFAVFLEPPLEQEGGRAAEYLQDRMRRQTWELLSRIDRAGLIRARILAGTEDFDVSAEARVILDNLRACYRDLACVPITADELRWLASLRSDAPGSRLWWEQAADAVRSLDDQQRAGIRLCHAEPIRWASLNRPEWLGASRDDLAGILQERLAVRDHAARTRRSGPSEAPVPESLDRWRTVLRWPDLLAALVADEALQSPTLRHALFQQMEMDRQDDTTEYGGIIQERDGEFRATLYPPRPAQRTDDFSFVASADMLRDSDHALLHYHFHAQETHNAPYAGPSRKDILYAADHGRNCLVLTPIDPDHANADFYCPAGAVIDLGHVRRPPAP